MEKDKLRAVLVMHARRYPAMKPQDVIKLCYQSEFGGGHLIRDIQSSLQFIAEEMASVESGYPAELLEEIGKSDYETVRKEIALIAESGKPILGTVYF